MIPPSFSGCWELANSETGFLLSGAGRERALRGARGQVCPTPIVPVRTVTYSREAYREAYREVYTPRGTPTRVYREIYTPRGTPPGYVGRYTLRGTPPGYVERDTPWEVHHPGIWEVHHPGRYTTRVYDRFTTLRGTPPGLIPPYMPPRCVHGGYPPWYASQVCTWWVSLPVCLPGWVNVVIPSSCLPGWVNVVIPASCLPGCEG